jgi:LCP family protein required for cell wall assembly
MMVMSIDPKTKDVAMISIPRDLYVPIPGYGYAKINAANAYGEQQKTGNGPVLAKAVVQNILDIPIHYYAQIDFTGFKKAVDAVGGIDINVTQALYDPEYPCDNDEGRACGYTQKAGQIHMNGSLALKYARCRKGNCGNDFGRAARQQEVLVALRAKAMSLGTLANPTKIASLIDIIGSSARTDLQLSEMKKLADMAKDIDTSKIVNKVIDGETTNLVTTASDPFAGSIVIPVAGSGNFSEIQAFAHTIFVDHYLKDENARLEVQNGTTKAGLATTVGTMLKSYQYNVVSMVNAPNQNYATTVLYDYSSGKKPYTISYLENRFGVKAQKTAPPSADSPEIVLILGADYKPR